MRLRSTHLDIDRQRSRHGSAPSVDTCSEAALSHPRSHIKQSWHASNIAITRSAFAAWLMIIVVLPLSSLPTKLFGRTLLNSSRTILVS